MEDLQNNILIGIISGVIAGLIVAVSQSVIAVYGQPPNILLLCSIAIFLVILIIIGVAAYNTSRDKKTN